MCIHKICYTNVNMNSCLCQSIRLSSLSACVKETSYVSNSHSEEQQHLIPSRKDLSIYERQHIKVLILQINNPINKKSSKHYAILVLWSSLVFIGLCSFCLSIQVLPVSEVWHENTQIKHTFNNILLLIILLYSKLY